MLEELLTKLREITASAAADLEAAKTEADIDAVKNRTLGRNGAITALSPMMGKLPNESIPPAKDWNPLWMKRIRLM